MSSNGDDNSPPSPTNRRASIAGSRISELFGRTPPMTNGTSPFPGSIAAAAAQQANQRRRMSIATVGLSASPGQTSPFRPRNDSFSTNGSESAIDDSSDATGMSPSQNGSSFARRLSFGARSMASISGPSPLSSTPPSSKSRAFASRLKENHEEEDESSQAQTLSSPTSSNFFNRRTGEGNGFNWSNEMRNRAQRSSSITSPTGSGAGLSARFPQKAASVSETPTAPPPPAVKTRPAPDHFQERILKGDFYMD